MRTFFWRQEVFREFAWLFHRGKPAESWGYLSKTHWWPNSGESSDPLQLITPRCRSRTGNVGEKECITGSDFFPRGRSSRLVLRGGIPLGEISGSKNKPGRGGGGEGGGGVFLSFNACPRLRSGSLSEEHEPSPQPRRQNQPRSRPAQHPRRLSPLPAPGA